MLTNSPRDHQSNSNTRNAALGTRILDLADRLAQYSESSDALTCTFMTPAHRAVAAELQATMGRAGMNVHIDGVGNVVGRCPGRQPEAGTMIVGSHYDTVRNAGKYDGRLGILAGIVAIEELHRRDMRLPFAVEVVGFSEEEGVRFSVPYIGSAAISGRFNPADLDRRDATGQSLAEVLQASGSDPAGIGAIRRDDKLIGYVEVHIEQGPVLLETGLPLGVVEAIAGTERFRIVVEGRAGHAGTVPMSLRHDAAVAAAEVVGLVERRCSQVSGLVGTVGELHVPNGAINVIPGQCELSLDIRAGDGGTLANAVNDIVRETEAIASRRGVAINIQKLMQTHPVSCSPKITNALADSIGRQGLPVSRLLSGAGHDALMFDRRTDIGMLFVRCGNNGVSHSPLETITAEDADIAARVLIDFLINFNAS